MPHPGSRALILGPTGSGKTELALWILSHWPQAPVVIYDYKAEPRFAQLPRSVVVFDWSDLIEASYEEEVDYIIFRPPEHETHNPDALDDYLLAHYEALPRVAAYIDELNMVGKAPPRPGLTALLTRGRGRDITTIMASQRPAGVSLFAYSETRLFYVYALTLRGDRARVAEYVPGFLDNPQPPRHCFWRYELGSEGGPELLCFRPFVKPPAAPVVVDEPHRPAREWL